MLTEQASCSIAIWVHHVHQWVGILGKRGCKDDDFKDLGHLLQKVLRSGPLHDENVRNTAFDIYRDGVVWIAHQIKLTVNKRLIEV